MEKTLTWTNFYSHPRFWRHVIPWTVVVGFLYLTIFLEEDGKEAMAEQSLSLITVFLSILLLIYGSFYAYNILYKKQRKKLLFFITLIAIIIVASLIDHYANSRIMTIGTLKGFWANLSIFPIILLVAFGLKLSYHGTRQLFVIERLQAKQTESELKLLKSQVNPHFLFNTLNNIYSTNLEDSDKANEIILELSDLLRYQLESNKEEFSTLAKEIKNLENYIHLEKIRVKDCYINVTKEGNFQDTKILPLLLLPFVENAFKYGTGIEPGKIEVQISLNNKKEFRFYIKNKITQKKGKVHSGGIGLDNVKKRLELMYYKKYDLDINTIDGHFIVDLKMQL